jgi:hypothetical protein
MQATPSAGCSFTAACDPWRDASNSKASFHAEVYEWQIAALLATAKLDADAKARIVAALGPSTPQPDLTTVRRC